MKAYVVTKHSGYPDESSSCLVGVYSNKETAEKVVNDFNSTPTFHEAVEKELENQIKHLKVDAGPAPVPAHKKPVFDQEYKHDEIYRQQHMMLMAKYRHEKKEFKKKLNEYEGVKYHLYTQKVREMRASIQNILSVDSFRDQRTFYEMIESEFIGD